MLDGGDELVGDAGPSEETAGLVRAHAPEAAAETRVAENLGHGDAEILAIEGIGEEGVPAEGEGAVEAAVDGEDGGRAAGHRFDRGHAERLVAAAQHEQVG